MSPSQQTNSQTIAQTVNQAPGGGVPITCPPLDHKLHIVPHNPGWFGDATGWDLVKEVKRYARPHWMLGYPKARQELFTFVEQQADGTIHDIYGIGDVAGGHAFAHGGVDHLNTEHVFPKSRGCGRCPAKSDLHHLLPADAHANSVRSSYDFGEVKAPHWECEGGAKCGTNAKGRHVFEPPDGDKGRVARATLYMASVYDLGLGPRQGQLLQRWSNQHPPDALERQHNQRASDVQGNRNPFVDQPELVNRLPW